MERYLGLPPDGSAHGPEIDFLIGLLHWIMYILFAGWGIYFLYTLWRFRSRKGVAANYHGTKSHFSTYSEVGVIVIEAVLLVGFSIPLWADRVADLPDEKSSTVVRVVAEQFAWNIHYPGVDGVFGATKIELVGTDNPLGLDRSDPAAADDITTINQLNLPVDKPIIVHLSSKDVIHSFGIPPYRVKQDAIPGVSIPVWWLPVKTTEQIRAEMTTTFSITEAMATSAVLSLPVAEDVAIKAGENRTGYYVLADQNDASGSTLLYADDELTADNVAILVEGGITTVRARRGSGLGGFLSVEELATPAGEALVASHELLSEDVVTRLVVAGIQSVRGRKASFLDPWVLMEDVTGKSGEAVGARLDMLTEELITKLADAGRASVSVAPSTPSEIACAQLCGLGHYRMRGYVTVQTPTEFAAWMDEQAALLEGAGEMGESGDQQDGEQESEPAAETSTETSN
jgi:cytochrome c oxidase subunit 2